MKATHHCMKTYFVRNRMGETKSITVPALYVRGLPQDLLGGKSLTRQNIRVILDDDADIGGIYPLDDDRNPHYQDSFEFINDPARDTDLFYLQTEQMDWTTFEELTGYDLWHRRLGHIPHQNIKDTIHHSIGLEDLAKKRFKPDEKGPSCMIGKSTLENYPGSLEPAMRPLARVNMDLYSSSVTSIEGYNHALVFTDSNSSFRWEYGMKTKNETFSVSKRWFAEIAEIRERYPLLMVMRDNSGENTSQELNDFFTDNGVKNYYSTPYEQWQNGLAESSVNSITLLGRTVMAESGLGGRFWFAAVTHGVNCRNATFNKRVGTTPHEKIFGVKKYVSKFRPFGCRAYMHLNKERREKGRHAPRAIEVINLGLATDENTSGYKFYIESSGKTLISNQAKFDENLFPYRNPDMINELIDEFSQLDVMYPEPGEYQWIQFGPDVDLNNFENSIRVVQLTPTSCDPSFIPTYACG